MPAFADLVCYWFERARATISRATRQSELVCWRHREYEAAQTARVLKRIKKTGDIFWARADRNWILDGAAVHVSMIGFDNGNEQQHDFGRCACGTINADLTANMDLTQAQTL